MAVARKKLSKSGWILLGILAILVIALPILHFTGIIDLSFLGTGYVGLMMWASENGWNALITGTGHVTLGILLFYGLKSYIIGEKQVMITTTSGGYSPQPSVPSQPQQKDETVIST
jgi:hypothetical protein